MRVNPFTELAGYHFLQFKDPFNLPKTEQVRGFFGQEAKPVKRYNVAGYIRFDFAFREDLKDPPTAPPDVATLRQAIREADEAEPWEDNSGQSIRYLSAGAWVDCQGHETCVFKIVPPHNTMNQAQMYAYEKHLAVLANNLAGRRIARVESVICAIEASTSQRIMVPSAP